MKVEMTQQHLAHLGGDGKAFAIISPHGGVVALGVIGVAVVVRVE